MYNKRDAFISECSKFICVFLSILIDFNLSLLKLEWFTFFRVLRKELSTEIKLKTEIVNDTTEMKIFMDLMILMIWILAFTQHNKETFKNLNYTLGRFKSFCLIRQEVHTCFPYLPDYSFVSLIFCLKPNRFTNVKSFFFVHFVHFFAFSTRIKKITIFVIEILKFDAFKYLKEIFV